MTDKFQLINQIKETVDTLNTLINQAKEYNISVKLNQYQGLIAEDGKCLVADITETIKH